MSRLLTLSAVFCLSTVAWFGLARSGVEIYRLLSSQTDPAVTASVE